MALTLCSHRVARLLKGLLFSLLFGMPWVAGAQSLVDIKQAAERAKDPVEKAFYQELADIQRKLSAASGLSPRVLVSDDEDVNAYATEEKGERIIVLNWGLLDALQSDRDAIVAVMAHEYAHHGKNHIAKSKSTSSTLGVLGAVAGALINYKLGTRELGNSVGRTGAKMLNMSFSRDQEREADAQGLQWMVQAGYNPLGAVRVQQKLTELAGSNDKFSLFRTHPPSATRAKELQDQIAAMPAAKPLLDQALVALKLPEDDDSDDDSTEMANAPTAGGASRTAFAPPKEPAAGSLAPVNGFTLEQYCAFVNELAAASVTERAKVYSKFKLTEASSQALTEGWTARMRSDIALANWYGMAFMDASIGPFAAHGRQVASAMRTGSAINGDPPLAKSDVLALTKDQARLYKELTDPGAAAAAFEDASRAKGVSSYDFRIAQQWWLTLASQRAQRGDMALLAELTSAF